MQQQFSIRLLPSEAASESTLRRTAASHAGVDEQSITGVKILKRSIDARGKQPWVNLTLRVAINEPLRQFESHIWQPKKISRNSRQVLIAGAGPAGLFSALKLIEAGIRPIIIERGKDVKARRRDLARLNKEGVINPDSNYCFGEGGAGTYSDGKLYTRSKRGNISRILHLFAQFGADESILYDTHPHIGTNKLPQIITSIREAIFAAGGEFLFDKKVTDFIIEGETLKGIRTFSGESITGDAVILATGHSARDIFKMLYDRKIEINFKPFALGVRIEHPQELIDQIQYHQPERNEFLPPASYSLVQQVDDHGVFSFCMCPGGIIAPAATCENEVVINGWSPSKRNNPYANSGMVVTVSEEDVSKVFKQTGPLAGMNFQQAIEKKAYEAGGGKFIAPAQRMIDFIDNKYSSSLPSSSYIPGINSALLSEILPDFIYQSLRKAFHSFGNKMKGFTTNDAVVVGVESRTSSPVRIPRDPVSLQHSRLKQLYPCGEGAGYAGGIVSAAIDGERVAEKAIQVLNS
ncbi:MAG TPA: FAD-dependent monooxygenase [Flavitalea sp.]|nr:FAD-dependent monooxygenase [Flavitalea sp.]